MNKQQKVKQMNTPPKGAVKKTKSTVVTVPAAIGNKIIKPKANVNPLKDGIRVSNTEYIAELAGSINFNVNSYSVQPGNGDVFPWLANLAAMYETYTFEKLVFHFKTEKSTSTSGTVLMAVDYDASDSAPLNKQQLMTYSNAVRTQPWANIALACPATDLQKIKTRFVNFGVIPIGADQKLYNVGNLFVCTQGCADTTVLGELYVEYTVVFRTPQYDANAWAAAGSNLSTGTTGITAARVLGTAPALNTLASGLAITYDTNSGAIGFRSTGTYLVVLQTTVGAATTGTLGLTLTGGSVATTPTTITSATSTISTFTVRILNVGDTLTCSGLTYTTPTASSLRIASYPYGM